MARSRVEQFRSLVAREPENEKFRFSLAQALATEGHAAEALPHYEFCVTRQPDWMVPRIVLGKLLLQLNRRPEAKAHLQKALQLAREQSHEDPERELQALLADM